MSAKQHESAAKSANTNIDIFEEQKEQMGTKQLEKTYNPSGMEDRIYHRWLEKGWRRDTFTHR